MASKQLNASPETRAIPVLALSAVETARESAHAAGCVAFLAKPCMPELLWWQLRLILKLDRI
jgi:CheY-like chemotaxis protein